MKKSKVGHSVVHTDPLKSHYEIKSWYYEIETQYYDILYYNYVLKRFFLCHSAAHKAMALKQKLILTLVYHKLALTVPRIIWIENKPSFHF